MKIVSVTMWLGVLMISTVVLAENGSNLTVCDFQFYGLGTDKEIVEVRQ